MPSGMYERELVIDAKHILVYKEIHSRLRSIAIKQNTTITKVASSLLKEALKLKYGGGDNDKEQ